MAGHWLGMKKEKINGRKWKVPTYASQRVIRLRELSPSVKQSMLDVLFLYKIKQAFKPVDEIVLF